MLLDTATIASIVDAINQFGFPIVIACWAIWRLDRTWGKGKDINTSLTLIKEEVDEIKELVKKSMEIQSELITTIKIIQIIIGGDTRR